ncbi:MAG TPA: exo-beta-N-acetylmuramidase NamZ domain-containing protein, partial [Candidatus Tumulicola sp.]
MRRSRFLTSTSAAALAAAMPRVAAAQSTTPFALGDDVFLDGGWRELAGQGVGIITNQSGVTSSGQSVVDAIRERTQLNVRAIFAPEHGFRGDRPAGASVSSYVDAQTGLPVY